MSTERDYVALRSPIGGRYSPSPSRHSYDSDDSLRALEVPNEDEPVLPKRGR